MTVIVWDGMNIEDRRILGTFDTKEKADKFIEDNKHLFDKPKRTQDTFIKLANRNRRKINT